MVAKRLAVIGAGIAGAVAVALGGCAASPEPADLSTDAVIIDVRTPAEFAAGHLEGAVNINLQSPDFEQQIADLDSDGEYIVYCQSGNRSAQAVAAMEAEGLDVDDAGGLGDATRSTGLEVVN